MTLKILILMFSSINLAQSYFDVQMDRFELLFQDTNCVDVSSIKIRKVNKTRSIVGDIKLMVPFDDDVIIESKGLKKQGGEYRQMPYHVQPTKLCEFIAKDGREDI